MNSRARWERNSNQSTESTECTECKKIAVHSLKNKKPREFVSIYEIVCYHGAYYHMLKKGSSLNTTISLLT